MNAKHQMNPVDYVNEGLAPEVYASEAQGKTRHQLHKQLSQARRNVQHHGRHSFVAREARKEIAAIEAEMRSRGMAITT